MLQPVGAATYQLNINVPGLGGESTAPGTGLGDVGLDGDPVRAKLQLGPEQVLFVARQTDGPLTRSARLTNIGTGPAVLSGIESKPDFSVSSTCAGTLHPGAWCDIAATFTPKTVGDVSDSILIRATGALAPVELAWHASVVALTAPTPWLWTSSEYRELGSTEPGIPLTGDITVKNIGNATAQLSGIESSDDFRISSDCPTTLAVGASCTLSATFKSFTPGRHHHTLQLRAAPDGPQTRVIWYADVIGVPDALPALVLSETLLDFALEGAAASAPQSSTVTNIGTAPAILSGIASNADFDVSSTCPAVLAEGGHCLITAKMRLTASPGAKYPMTLRAQGQPAATLLMVGPPNGLDTDGTPKPGTDGLDFTPARLTFGDVSVGSSLTKTTTVSNIGADDASLRGLAVSTPSVYSQSNNCPATIAPGTSCEMSVTFSPKNASDYPDMFQVDRVGLRLNGTGTQAQLVVAPTVMDFGVLPPGTYAKKVLHLANSGNIPLRGLQLGRPAAPFVLESTNCPATLERAQGCTATVGLTASGAGGLSGTLQLSTANHPAPAVPLTAQIAQIRLSPNALTFGETALKTSAAVQTVTVTNDGAQSVALQLGMVSGSDSFNQSNNCGSVLAGGASCTVSVKFTPSMAGVSTGEVGIASGPAALARIALSGTGSNSGLFLSSYALSFDDTKVGQTSDAEAVIIRNDSATPTTITGLGLVDTPSDFSQSNNCGTTLAPAASCRVVIQMTPSQAGTRLATLGLDSSQGRYAVALSGAGTVPVAELPGLGSPSSPGGGSDGYTHYAIKFLETEFGKSSDVRNVTFRNIGTGPLTLTGISLVSGAADFSQSNNCDTLLAPGASCTIAIMFTPSSAGDLIGGIALHSETGNYFFDLSGKGVAGNGIWSTSPSADFGMVTANTSVQRQFTLTNRGGGSASNLVTEVVGANLTLIDTTCGTPGAPVSLAPGVSCRATVVYSPTAPGELTDAMLKTSGNLPKPAVLALKGISPKAGLTFNPTSADYGTLSVQAPSPKSFTLKNVGQVSDTITALTVSGESFAITGGTCVVGKLLPANGVCTVIATAAINEVGDAAGTLRAISASRAGASVDLAGTGVRSVYSISGTAAGITEPSTNLGNISLEAVTPITKSYYLKDAAAIALVRATNVTLTGDAGFKIQGIANTSSSEGLAYGCPFNATESTGACQATASYPIVRIQIRFTPTTVLGQNNATLRIQHNGAGEDFVLNLSAEVKHNPEPELSATSLKTTAISGDMGAVSFGSPDGFVGAPVTRTVFIRNVGQYGKLSVTPTLDGDSDFKLTSVVATSSTAGLSVTCGATIDAEGKSASECLAQDVSYGGYPIIRITVAFAPKASGTRSAKLILVHNGSSPSTPLTWDLTGMGLYDAAAALSAYAGSTSPANGSFGTKAVGAAVTKTFFVRNVGTLGKLGVTPTLAGDSDFTLTKVTADTYTYNCGAVIDPSGQSASQCLAQDRRGYSYPNVRIDIAFKPSAKGLRTSSLVLEHTGINGPEPIVLPLTGTGL